MKTDILAAPAISQVSETQLRGNDCGKLKYLKAHSYQYTFAPNTNWSSFYAPAQEIREYLEGIVRKYSVDRFIRCSHKVVDARWDDKRAKWYGEFKHEILASR
jgi:hypothetical protein